MGLSHCTLHHLPATNNPAHKKHPQGAGSWVHRGGGEWLDRCTL
jgi:hypothetical protein